jgi:hypothetical protein
MENNELNSGVSRKGLALLVGAVFVVLLIVLLPSKEQQKQSAPQVNDETKVEESGETLLPDFPDFPKYSSARIVSSKRERLGDQITYTAKYNLDGSVDNVLTWYKDNLEEDGFTIGETTEGGDKFYAYLDGVTYAFEVGQGENRDILTVTATYDED